MFGRDARECHLSVTNTQLTCSAGMPASVTCQWQTHSWHVRPGCPRVSPVSHKHTVDMFCRDARECHLSVTNTQLTCSTGMLASVTCQWQTHSWHVLPGCPRVSPVNDKHTVDMFHWDARECHLSVTNTQLTCSTGMLASVTCQWQTHSWHVLPGCPWVSPVSHNTQLTCSTGMLASVTCQSQTHSWHVLPGCPRVSPVSHKHTVDMFYRDARECHLSVTNTQLTCSTGMLASVTCQWQTHSWHVLPGCPWASPVNDKHTVDMFCRDARECHLSVTNTQLTCSTGMPVSVTCQWQTHSWHVLPGCSRVSPVSDKHTVDMFHWDARECHLSVTNTQLTCSTGMLVSVTCQSQTHSWHVLPGCPWVSPVSDKHTVDMFCRDARECHLSVTNTQLTCSAGMPVSVTCQWQTHSWHVPLGCPRVSPVNDKHTVDMFHWDARECHLSVTNTQLTCSTGMPVSVTCQWQTHSWHVPLGCPWVSPVNDKHTVDMFRWDARECHLSMTNTQLTCSTGMPVSVTCQSQTHSWHVLPGCPRVSPVNDKHTVDMFCRDAHECHLSVTNTQLTCSTGMPVSVTCQWQTHSWHVPLGCSRVSPVSDKHTVDMFHWDARECHLSMTNTQLTCSTEMPVSVTCQWQTHSWHVPLGCPWVSPVNDKHTVDMFHWDARECHLSVTNTQLTCSTGMPASVTCQWQTHSWHVLPGCPWVSPVNDKHTVDMFHWDARECHLSMTNTQLTCSTGMPASVTCQWQTHSWHVLWRIVNDFAVVFRALTDPLLMSNNNTKK